MIWEHWLIAISIGIVALAFVALVVFLILTILSMRQMVIALDQKAHSFDPLFRVVSKAGRAIEKKASSVKQLSEEFDTPVREGRGERSELEGEHRREIRSSTAVNTAMEVAEWAMIGMALWQKIKEKKR